MYSKLIHDPSSHASVLDFTFTYEKKDCRIPSQKQLKLQLLPWLLLKISGPKYKFSKQKNQKKGLKFWRSLYPAKLFSSSFLASFINSFMSLLIYFCLLITFILSFLPSSMLIHFYSLCLASIFSLIMSVWI